MEIEEESGVQDLQAGSGVAPDDNITMVGLDDDFMEVKDLLLSDSKKLKIVSLVGMGGIGKTTLGKAIYKDLSIHYRFDIHAWVTVSQYFDVRQTIIALLDSMGNHTADMLSRSIDKLEEYLYKSLKGKRCLIVIDDVWDTNVWENLRRLFLDEGNASRILLTTRFKNVAAFVGSNPLLVHFLNEDASWKLFRDKVFGKDGCPPELEAIGKRIVRNCQGLSLAIVVISGLLSKATRTRHYWENVAEHLSSVIIANDEQCMKTLSLSYSVLSHDLKRCFLYMTIFPKDYDIGVSMLVKLWVGEELSKADKSKSSEDVAYEYLLDLVDRSLILVDKQSSMGRIKTCKIHDLVRDFCTREVERNMFFCITDKSLYGIPPGADLSCLCINNGQDTPYTFPCDEVKLSSLIVRSLVSFDWDIFSSVGHLNSEQLRVFSMLFIKSGAKNNHPLSSSECKFPLLQVLIFDQETYSVVDPQRVWIWNMPQLRHIQAKELLFLPDPLEGGYSITILENLQTLSIVKDFKCSKDVLERIPNLKKLGICLTEENGQHYHHNLVILHGQRYLYNLVHLHKLEVFKLKFRLAVSLRTSLKYVNIIPLEKFSLPSSLKKLTLEDCHLSQENMVIFGLLPNLQVLKLKCKFIDQEWEPTKGEFLELKYLHLETDLKHWRADSIHYPKLQRLIIRRCYDLEEIPCGFGEIVTLQLIELHNPMPSLMVSAEKIQEEQLDVGNHAFKLTKV